MSYRSAALPLGVTEWQRDRALGVTEWQRDRALGVTEWCGKS